jgi:hypothetical protein
LAASAVEDPPIATTTDANPATAKPNRYRRFKILLVVVMPRTLAYVMHMQY